METGFIVLIAALFGALGFFLGVLYISNSRKTTGTIHVDYSDPIDGPHLFLELKAPIPHIVSKRQVVLDVDTTQYYSR